MYYESGRDRMHGLTNSAGISEVDDKFTSGSGARVRQTNNGVTRTLELGA